MGDCYIIRRGGSSGPAYSLPVLNEAYPQDVTVVASANGSASFTVQITQPGTPAEYTYQWYQNGSAIASATAASVTLTGLTEAASHTVYCEVTNKAGTVTSRVATLTVKDWLPVYAYTGNATLLNDGNYNWRIKFLTSGVLTFSSLGNADSLDVFLVGGGGGGGRNYGGGGGGGYTVSNGSVALSTGTGYTITIGAGGSGGQEEANAGSAGGTSSAFSKSAAGGKGGGSLKSNDRKGGDGGSGGGGGGTYKTSGGTDGGNGTAGSGSTVNGAGGTGQGTSTREFAALDNNTSATLYSSGGNGTTGTSGVANTGDGGAGSIYTDVKHDGGSGIVIIRNHR